MNHITFDEFYEGYLTYDYDTFIFFPEVFNWSREEVIITSSESIYDNDEVSDCDTPLELYRQGFRFKFVISEVRTAYSDAWISNGGEKSFKNFVACLKNYLKNDGLIFPTP